MALNYRDFGNEEFNAFVEDSNNYGRLTVLSPQSVHGPSLAVMKVAVDDRFAVLFGDTFYAGSDSNNPIEEALSSFFQSRDGAAPLGLLDTATGNMSIYFELSHFLDPAHNLNFVSIEDDFKQALNTYIEDYVNDPANRDALVKAALNLERFTEPNPRVVDEDIKKYFVQGKSLEEVQNQRLPVDVTLSIGSKVLMDYMKDPQGAISKYAGLHIEANKEAYGSKILHQEAVAKAFEERIQEASPNLTAARNMLSALDKTFGDDLPGKLRVTVARDGKEVQFQYPAEYLVRELRVRPEDYLNEYEVTPVSAREGLYSNFGYIYHDQREHFSDPSLFASDVVDISFRGKSIYTVPADVYADKMQTREVQVQVFSPIKEAREAIDDSPRYALNRKINMDKAVALSPDAFEAVSEPYAVTVGTHANFDAMCSDIIKDSGQNNIGNLIAVDGKVYMADNYAGFKEMPFKADALPGYVLNAREQTAPARSMSLADRANGAKEVSGELAQDAPERNFDIDAR